MSIEEMMPSNHLSSAIPLSSCPQSFPASGSFPVSRLFASGWSKYWSFSFSISPSNEYSGLISFRSDWLILLQAFIFSVLETWSPRSRCRQVCFSWDPRPLLFLQVTVFTLCPTWSFLCVGACVSLHFLVIYRCQSYWIRTHPKDLMLITSLKTLSPNMVQTWFWSMGVRASMWILGVCNPAHNIY